MKFEVVIPALREGRKARRSCWESGRYIAFLYYPFCDFVALCDEEGCIYTFVLEDINANDWEIFKETKKVKLGDLTLNQFHS